MLLKMGSAAALLCGGMWATGMLGGGYSREVGRSQAEVMRALEDLDITAQPGGPDIDPSRSGGVKPLFRLTREPNAMTWTVMSGEQVATRMTARFAAVDATHTRVTAEVERGDAPDDYVSPAFRSKGITLGLFGIALESELDELTAPTGNQAACDKMMEDRQFAAPAMPSNREWGLGDGVRNVMALTAMATERKRLGCKDGFSDEPLVQHMKPAVGDDRPVGSPEISFEPGKPMLDPTPRP